MSVTATARSGGSRVRAVAAGTSNCGARTSQVRRVSRSIEGPVKRTR